MSNKAWGVSWFFLFLSFVFAQLLIYEQRETIRGLKQQITWEQHNSKPRCLR